MLSQHFVDAQIRQIAGAEVRGVAVVNSSTLKFLDQVEATVNITSADTVGRPGLAPSERVITESGCDGAADLRELVARIPGVGIHAVTGEVAVDVVTEALSIADGEAIGGINPGIIAVGAEVGAGDASAGPDTPTSVVIRIA